MTKAQYWVGTLGCPIQNIQLGGVTFPAVTNENGKRKHLGAVVDLDEKQVEAVKAQIEDTVVRVVRHSHETPLARKSSKGYEARETDRPLAEFVFLREGEAGKEKPASLAADLEAAKRADAVARAASEAFEAKKPVSIKSLKPKKES